MKTLFKLGEFFGDPILGNIVLVILILPALWALFKLLEWSNLCDSGKMRDKIIEEE